MQVVDLFYDGGGVTAKRTVVYHFIPLILVKAFAYGCYLDARFEPVQRV